MRTHKKPKKKKKVSLREQVARMQRREQHQRIAIAEREEPNRIYPSTPTDSILNDNALLS